MKPIFTDKNAREILEKYYPLNGTKRELVKTIHKAGYDDNQVDCILYSLLGSPAKGVLVLSIFHNKIKTIRVLDYWGNLTATIFRFNDYEIME
ncbi:hypothetical protein KAR91_02465 [Candidatus Pacearchaeota archaeon]|nr:hypothetical protein [Candidatus Pacearchaeota archaeon]